MSDVECPSICPENADSLLNNDNPINNGDGPGNVSMCHDGSALSMSIDGETTDHQPSQSYQNNNSHVVPAPTDSVPSLSDFPKESDLPELKSNTSSIEDSSAIEVDTNNQCNPSTEEPDGLSIPDVPSVDSNMRISYTTDNNVDLNKIKSSNDFNYSEEANQFSSQTNAIESIPENSQDSNVVVSEQKEEEDVLVQVKEEPYSLDYEQASYFYRGPIVVYSSTDEDSSDSDSSESSVTCQRATSEPEVISDDEEGQKQSNVALVITKTKSRTRGEIFPEELPPFEYLTISPGEEVSMVPLGWVTGIVGVLVVIRANRDTPALYDDTVLFSELRAPLGLIFEVFGTVEQPYYSVRFNKAADIKEKHINIGDSILYAPKADNLTKYVFIKELQSMKYDDASWENDNEPPAEHRDFSDDEEEKRVKAKKKNSRRDQSSNIQNDAPKRNKRTVRPDESLQSNGNTGHPGLLKGDLTRNPFGNRPRPLKKPGISQWPPPGPPRNNSNSERPPWFSSPPPPGASFGERPNWEHQQSRFRSPSFVNRFNGPPPQASPVSSGQARPLCPPGPARPPCPSGPLFAHGPPGRSGPPGPMRPSFRPGPLGPPLPRGPTDIVGRFRGPPPFQSGRPPRPGQFPPMPNPETGGRGMFNPSVPPPSFRSLFNSPPPPPH